MNALWLLFAAFAVVGLQALLFAAFGRRALGYRRYFSRAAAFEGERVQMIEQIANRKLLPLPWVRVESRMSPHLRFGRVDNLQIAADQYHSSIFALGPWRKITRTHEVTCMRRGYYRVQSAAIAVGDLFALSTHAITCDLDAALTVYPRIYDFDTLRIPSQRWQGDVVVRRFIEPDPFLINGIRAFRTGDMIKDIHWGATARTGQLQVKTRDYTASPRLLLALNVQLKEQQWGELTAQEQRIIEHAISLAATYAAWARANGVETALCCNGRLAALDDTPVAVGMGGGEAHLIRMLDTLAHLRILRRRSFVPFLEDEVIRSGVTGADIVIISAYWSQLLEECAGRIRRMGNSVTWVNAATQ